MPGENAPPMHPNCHCSTSAAVDEEALEEWLDSYKDHGLSFEDWRSENMFHTYEDPLREKLGSAFESHPQETQAIIDEVFFYI